jgi:hypothetical protein
MKVGHRFISTLAKYRVPIDLDHKYGSDLSISPPGSYSVVTGSNWSSQRVIRRLLTCKGDDPFNPDYGGNLSAQIGLQVDLNTIEGIVRRQMAEESAVDSSQPISVSVLLDDTGAVYVSVEYIDADSGDDVSFNVPLSPLPIS